MDIYLFGVYMCALCGHIHICDLFFWVFFGFFFIFIVVQVFHDSSLLSACHNGVRKHHAYMCMYYTITVHMGIRLYFFFSLSLTLSSIRLFFSQEKHIKCFALLYFCLMRTNRIHQVVTVIWEQSIYHIFLLYSWRVRAHTFNSHTIGAIRTRRVM